MNKKALIGKLILIIGIVIALIIAIIYFTGSFGFRTGKVSVNINYDESAENGKEIIIGNPIGNDEDTKPFVEELPENSLPLNSSEQNSSLNYTNISR